MTIGYRIKLCREAKDMTLEELSKFVGVSRQTLSRYETGKIPNIPSDKIELIADTLKVSPAYLMGWNEAPGDPLPDDMVVIDHIATIAAGYDQLASIEEIEKIQIPRFMLKGYPPSECKMLTVKGNSMYPRYLEGDRIIYHAQTSVDSDSIAVIQYNGEEATLKKVRYVSGEDWMELIPINPEYQTKRVEGRDLELCRVYGLVISSIRVE